MNGLTAKVEAVNLAHRAANDMYGRLVKVLAPFVGQKVLKVDGSLMAHVERAVTAALPLQHPHLTVYRPRYTNMLAWAVKADAMDSPNTCIYYEATVYIGKVTDQVLTELFPVDARRDNYTVEEIRHKQQAVKDARDVLDSAVAALNPFKEGDR